MSSIQDLGREGWLYYAIPQSGAMDRNSFHRANQLLGNPENNACIEFNMTAGRLEFLMDCSIVLTGAEMGFELDNSTIALNQVIKVKAHQVLKSKMASTGFRSYLSVNGSIAGDQHYGSLSTYRPGSLGAHQGQFLRAGDILKLEGIFDQSQTPIHTPSDAFDSNIFKIQPGPEFHLLSGHSQNLLQEVTFQISPDSNRMGARLLGPYLECTQDKLPYSVPVLPGFIQLPPSGQPIVILQDGQTTGGYNRIGYIAPEDLSRFNQVGIGEKVVLMG